VTASAEFLSPSEAARRLGLSVKALRVYEQRGLLAPLRSAAGWRVYGPAEMRRAGDIVALRGLGFSLAEIGRLLTGDVAVLEPALAAHQAVLESRLRDLGATVAAVRGLRDDLGRGRAPTLAEVAARLGPEPGRQVAFDLPWPWDGERFEIRDIRPLTYITGPLGSGKTRLAQRLAENLPGAAFLGLDRAPIEAGPDLEARIANALARLVEDGATASPALAALLRGLEAEGPSVLVVDLLEQGLDRASQEAVIARLRRRGPDAPPLFVMTRSTSILDLDAVGPDEAILYCPANHAVPMAVTPCPGAAGYEALASCLASPEVRARSDGVIAWRPSGLPSDGRVPI
jgi:DNA-binding transcriptional MerR regulator